MPVNLITQADYAKRRGVSQVAVHKAVKAGRISLIDGKIDPDVADMQWQRNTRARAGSGGPATQITVERPLAADPASVSADAPDYWESRARRERAEADRAEMARDEQAGRLIAVPAIRAQLATLLASTRDSLLQIPARLAPVVAAEADAAKVHDLLQSELHQALAQLTSAPERLAKPPADEPNRPQAPVQSAPAAIEAATP